ncbi:unnamed protein product [Leuciscus chuanchicus]
MGNEWSSAEMPRGKGFRRSQAAKRRNAECHSLSSFLDLEEVVPLLQKKATNSSEKNCPNCLIQGSYHQADSRFGFNSGRHCAANSVTAVMMSVLTWTTEDLNAVLLHGDELMMEHLYVTMSIENALQRALFQSDACLLNLHGYISAVIKAGSKFAVVDSHARDGKGMVSSTGRSVVVYCDDIYVLFNYVVNLAMSLKGHGKSFEVTGVTATVIGKAIPAGTSSIQSGQQCSVTQVSPTSAAEQSNSVGDGGKQTRVDKPATLSKVVETYQDSSKKNKRVQNKSKHKLLMDDDVSVGLQLNPEFSSKPLTADTSSNKSGQQCSVTQVSPTSAAEQSKCVGDSGKQTRVGKQAETHLDSSKKNKGVQSKSNQKLMDDDVSVGLQLNPEFSSQTLTADSSSNKSGQQDSVTQVSTTRTAEQSLSEVVVNKHV